jgi:hypothetical protein
VQGVYPHISINAVADANHKQSDPLSIRPLTGSINTQITITRKTEVLQQKAALKVLVGVQNRVEFARVPQVLILDLLG